MPSTESVCGLMRSYDTLVTSDRRFPLKNDMNSVPLKFCSKNEFRSISMSIQKVKDYFCIFLVSSGLPVHKTALGNFTIRYHSDLAKVKIQ